MEFESGSAERGDFNSGVSHFLSFPCKLESRISFPWIPASRLGEALRRSLVAGMTKQPEYATNSATLKSIYIHLSKIMRFAWVALLSFFIFASSTQAAPPKKTEAPTQVRKYMPPATQSTRLYTQPDPSAKGGIHGRIKEEGEKKQLLRDAFAISPDNPKLVYRGVVSADGAEFSFQGLPVAKYDLLLIGKTLFYEGFKLTPDADSLTKKDGSEIENIITKSVPFFNVKKIHRCQGITGRNGAARCVLQEVRTLPVTDQEGIVHPEYQVRSIRLACLENVGTAGWQLVNTREIIRMQPGSADLQGVLPHAYLPALGQIRVMDEIKELGEIDLAADKFPKP